MVVGITRLFSTREWLEEVLVYFHCCHIIQNYSAKMGNSQFVCDPKAPDALQDVHNTARVLVAYESVYGTLTHQSKHVS